MPLHDNNQPKPLKEGIQKDMGIKTTNNSIGKSPDEMWLEKATRIGTMIVECLQNGLSESDGCTLAGITLNDYEELKKRAPSFARLIEQTKIQYKLDLMKPITAAIKAGDVTKAQWIAERRFPAEFGQASKRQVAPVDDDRNPIADIVRRIQNGENTGAPFNKDILGL